MIRKLLVAIAIATLTFFSIAPSAAHGSSTISTPAADSKVLVMPSVVSIEFDGKLQTLGTEKINLITVTDPAGQVISDGVSLVEGAKLSTRISILDSTGLISVHYRIVSQDGHPVEGDYTFTVGPAPTLTSEATEEPGVNWQSNGVKEESKNLSFAGIFAIIILATTALVVIRRKYRKEG